jgi:hypothetical protein
MSVVKQLLLGALPLPSEIIHMIKEFAWMDVMVLANLRKSRIIKDICASTFTPDIDKYPYHHIFWITNERYQFQSYFCKCGNYEASNSIIMSKCKCNCKFV